MPVASSITEVDPDASETLLDAYRQMSRRFRRRNRRRRRQVQNGGDDTDSSDGGDNADHDWSWTRVERAQELDRLDNILTRENSNFHLHC